MQVFNCEQRQKRNARSAAWSKANRGRMREHARNYLAKNREKQLASTAAWADANPEKRAAINLAYRARSRKKLAARTKAWAKANPEKAAAISRNKRARRRAAEGSHTAADAAAIRKGQGDKCAYCRIKLRGAGHLDHIVALANGGSNWPANIQWLCGPCNVQKSTKDPIEFAQSKGMLL